MGLTDRTTDLLNTRVNALLDRLEDDAESADYAVERLRDELKRVKEAILDLVTEKKRLEQRRERLQERIEERNEQAREAVAAGREDLAREVLRKKQRELSDLEDLDEQISDLGDAQEELIERSEELERRVDHYRAERARTAARETAARADLATKGGVGVGGDADRYADSAVEEIDEREARAAALEELEERGVFDDEEDLDAELAQLRTDDEIEDELATIRKEMGRDERKTDAGERRRDDADDLDDSE